MWKWCEMRLHGTTLVGPKWQIVIPKEVREMFNISPWDTLTLVTKENKAIVLIKNQDISELFEYAKSEWINLS